MPKLLGMMFWAAALFAFTMAVLPHPPQLPAGDKAQHMLAFSVLAVLATVAYPRVPLIWLLACLAGFGAFIEVVQAIPQLHRDSDVHDWLADLIASAVALSAVFVWRRTFAPADPGDARTS